MIIDCISDLHGCKPALHGGDLLIVAGDLTARNTQGEYFKFFNWMWDLPYKKKIVCAGNHDGILEFNGLIGDKEAFHYLCDSGTEFEGLKIWGSPWTTRFEGMNPHCMAFTVDTDEELAEKWGKIPSDVDILVTHSPAYGNFDFTARSESVGSMSLFKKVSEIKPKLFVFGHIHESYGHGTRRNSNTIYVNASHVNENYKPVNPPIRIIL